MAKYEQHTWWLGVVQRTGLLTMVRGQIYTREGRGCLTVTSREAGMEMVTHKRRVTTRTLPDQTQPNCAVGDHRKHQSSRSICPPCFLPGQSTVSAPAAEEVLAGRPKVQYPDCVHLLPGPARLCSGSAEEAASKAFHRVACTWRVPCASATHCRRKYLML